MGETPQPYKAMKIVTDQTKDSHRILTSRAGLLMVGELLKRFKLSEWVDRLMPQAPRNRAYRSSTVFNTFMLIKHEGARCLDEGRVLHQESKRMGLLGLKRIPGARTLGNGRSTAIKAVGMRWLKSIGACSKRHCTIASGWRWRLMRR